MGNRMTNHMPNLSSSAAMVADEQSLPPYAPLAMPKQILSTEAKLSRHALSLVAALLSVLKPSIRDAN